MRVEIILERIRAENVPEHVTVRTEIARLRYGAEHVERADKRADNKKYGCSNQDRIYATENLIDDLERLIAGKFAQQPLDDRHNDDDGDAEHDPDAETDDKFRDFFRLNIQIILERRKRIGKAGIPARIILDRIENRGRKEKPDDRNQREIDEPPCLRKEALAVSEIKSSL